ncbi:MAG: YafY family protein [Pseudomonadota bacterium]
MRRAERLFRLVALMRANSLSRADDLAAALEVSVRTIYRDIAHLQGSGLPIEGEAGVGYVLRPGFDLPAMTFTHEQLDALALGLTFVEEAGDQDMVLAAQEVRAKIESGLPDTKRTALETAPFFAARRGLRAPPFTRSIRKAIRDGVVASLAYRDADGQVSSRDVQPLSLTVFTDGWMMAAWCRLRSDFRYFRLDRIEAFTLLEERFTPEPHQTLAAFRAREPHKSAPGV